jgi:hypothetical protein
MAQVRRRNRRPNGDRIRTTPASGGAPAADPADDQPPTAPPGWPTGTQISEVFDIDAAARAAVGAVAADDMVGVLQKLPPQQRQLVLNSIRLRSAGSVNRGMANQLIARLRQEEGLGTSAELRAISDPLLVLLRRDELSSEDWARLAADSNSAALHTLAEHAEFACLLAEAVGSVPASLLPAGLVCAIGANATSAAIALAYLAREDPQAREAHAALREEFPQMPAIPSLPLPAASPVSRLIGTGQLPAGSWPGPAQVMALLKAALDAELDSDALFDEDPLDGVDPADAGVEAGDLLHDWDAVAGRLAACAAAMQEGTLPAREEVAAFVSFVEEAENAFELAEELADGAEFERSRDGLTRAAESLGAYGAAAGDDQGWLAQLTAISAPTALEGAAGLIRHLAEQTAAGLEDDDIRAGLRGLYTLIELTAARRGGQPVDYDAASEAQGAALRQLPGEVGQLIIAAALGDLTLPAGEDADGDVNGPEAEAPLEGQTVPPPPPPPVSPVPQWWQKVPGAPVSPSPSSADAAQGDTDAAQGDSGLVKETAGQPAVPESAEAEQAVPDQAEEDRTAEPGALPDLRSVESQPSLTDEDPLADLDELLAGGAAASLAAATGARRAGTSGSGRTDRQPPRDDEARPSASPVERAVARQADTAAVEAELLRQGRFGLAADLRQALGQHDPEVAARRIAAYAAGLRQATGPLAAAFAHEAQEVTRAGLAGDRTGQLLAWAAAVRIAVLAPSTGAATLIADLSPRVSEYAALTEVGQLFAEASRSGLLILPEVASAVGALSAVETSAEELARQAEETVRLAPQRSLKYPPANRVYQIWMNPGGQLGELLGLVAENDPRHLTEVRDRVVRLRGQADRSIEEISAQQRRNPHAKIVSKAHDTLVNRWDDAVELASRWAQAADLTAERAYGMQAGRRQAGALATLRAQVREVRDAALDELAMITEGLPDGSGEGAAGLIRDAFTICDGRAPAGDDLPPEFVAHGELLATPLPLSPATLVPDAGLSDAEVPALVDVARTRPHWSEVYTSRATAGDHDLTAILISALQLTEPRLAASLSQRRDRDVARAEAAVTAETAEAAALVNARRLAGALDDDKWSALSARIDALQIPARRDFGRIRRELEAIRETLQTALTQKTDQTIARIEARAANSPAVAEAAKTLEDLTRRGQIASAEEFLEQVLSGGSLPIQQDGTDHLARFYPEVPDLAAAYPALLNDLDATLQGAPPSEPVRKLGELTGSDITKLSRARRELGLKAIQGWTLLTAPAGQANRLDATEAFRRILGQAGFEFGALDLDEEVSGQGGRRWATLRRVTGTGEALHPALGSAMSPDGATLRMLVVRRAASPATVVEWMSGELADHTVLVLWLAFPLAHGGRLAIANAARGRPRPPLLLLDAATLAYLICQLEPRRTTFAEITLPFTAMSPYRDTPGDVAQEMFYGRTEEMAAVLDLSGSSIVYGGRQLGKSALLRAAERRFGTDKSARASVLTSIFTIGADGHPERLWTTLWPKLAAAPHRVVDRPLPPEGDVAEAVYNGILAWLNANPERALLILLDEADAFLDADSAGNAFTNVDWCRRIHEDSGRRAKFVFAGLHRTARFESLVNQPLSHFGPPVLVGPLKPQHAYDLVTRPLAALGFRFADLTAIPARILALTNNMPALLQLFGWALVGHLTSRPMGPDGPPTEITETDVEVVLSNADLLNAFREKYVLTLNLDHRYLVIAYAVAQAAFERGVETTLSFGELEKACRDAWPQGFGSGGDSLRGLVNECVDFGVLAIDNGRYRLRTPMVLRLLGTEEEVFEALYGAPDRLSMPSASDAGFYRRRLAGSWRSPLTEAQLGRIFRERTGVFVVVGSSALGIERVIAALKSAHADGAGRFGQFVQAKSFTVDGLRRTIEMLTAPRAMVVVDAIHAKNELLADLLWTAADAIGVEELSNIAASVVFVAGPDNAATWATRDDLVELCPIDPIGLRLWCDEDGLPFRDDSAQADVLNTTGGWPKVMTRLAELQGAAGPVTSGAKALEEIRGLLPGARDLADAAGVGGEGSVLMKAFATAAALTAETGADPEYLADLLALDETHDLTADAKAAGFASVGDVITVLTLLGCLRAGPDGLLKVEPVLARALTAAGS